MNERSMSEEKLEQEQEALMLKFLQVMPDSLESQETILTQEDLEQIAKNENVFFGGNIWCRKEEQGVLTESEEVSCISRDAMKKHEGNTTKSHWKTRNSLKSELGEEENDSGFATSSEQFLKLATPESIREHTNFIHEGEMDSDLLFSDSEDSCRSMESVSLLQNPSFIDQGENREKGESCVNVAWNIKLFPPLPCDEDDIQVDEERVHSVDKSVQTVRFFSQPEEYMDKGTEYLRSIINLKYIILSKKNVSSKNYLDLLKNAIQGTRVWVTSSEESGNESDEMDKEECSCQFHEFEDYESSEKVERNQEVIALREVVHQVTGATNTEDMVQKSVESILVWLKNEMKKNCKHFCNYWHDSVRAESVDMITEVVDLHPGVVRARVSQFLIEIFDEIYESDSPVEDIHLEYKMAFLSCFCKSVLLSYDLIEHVSGKLFQFTKPRPRSKFQMVSLIKKNYFSLRLMSDLLRSFAFISAHLQTEGLQSIFCRKSCEEELHVLNLWKRGWRSDGSHEPDESDEQMGIKYINVMAEWCNRTDQVLNFCLEEIPLLVKPAHTCSILAHDIFFQDTILTRR